MSEARRLRELEQENNRLKKLLAESILDWTSLKIVDTKKRDATGGVHDGSSTKQYTKEFKQQAVSLITEQGASIAHAARDLGLRENLLRRWKKAMAQQGTQALPGHGNAQDDELTKLHHEVEILRRERAILKSRGCLLATAPIRYQLIQEHKSQFRAKEMCHVLGVTRSGCYAWSNRPVS